jgi:hypothetical protein
MSSIATVYFCEEAALEDLASLFKRTTKSEPHRVKIVQFMRESTQSETRLKDDILILTGLSVLLHSKYAQMDPLTLLRESLRNLSRDTIVLIEVQSLKWSPTKRSEINIDGKILKVASIDYETTMRIRNGNLQRKRDNFVIARL